MKGVRSAMDDLGDKLSSILSDPGQLDKIAQMAKSIMGGGEGQPREKSDDGFSLDPAMLTRLSAMMSGGGKNGNRELLEAMRPFLSEKRRKKVDKALRIAKLASFAEIAVKELGEEEGDV